MRPPLKFPAMKRRARRLAEFAQAMLRGRGDARPYTHVAWLGLMSLGLVVAQYKDFAWLLAPTTMAFVALALIVLYDAAYFVIPDCLALVLLCLGGLTLLAYDPGETALHLGAMVLGFAVLYGVALAYDRLRGEAGLGGGDVKLFGVAGLWLGFEGLPSCLLLAVASAALSALIALRAGALANARQPIPFGPHLALGFWLAWVVGPVQF
jgi:leader peptidase (prepilin peptidase)/N-methyltransferase